MAGYTAGMGRGCGEYTTGTWQGIEQGWDGGAGSIQQGRGRVYSRDGAVVRGTFTARAGVGSGGGHGSSGPSEYHLIQRKTAKSHRCLDVS